MAEKFSLPRQGVPDQPGSPAQTSMMIIQCVSDILIGILSSFFLFWGITLLLSAYSLKNPLEFIMLFFSSNFIILISGTGILYAAFRLWGKCKENIRPS
jgi:hypothetical protein